MPTIEPDQPKRGFNEKTLKLLEKYRRKDTQVVCVACGGTGLNSKGGLCYPCLVNGRTKYNDTSS